MSKKMKAPFLHTTDTVADIYLDIIVALMAAVVSASFISGTRVLIMCTIAVVEAIFIRMALCLLVGRYMTACDLYSIISALVIVLLCPSDVKLYIVLVSVGASEAISFFCSEFFGRRFIAPSLTGLAIAYLVGFSSMTSYPVITGQRMSALFNEGVVYGKSLMQMIGQGDGNIIRQDVLLGRVCGPAGAGVTLVLAACIVYLILKNRLSLWTVLPFVLTAALFGLLFPRVGGGLDSALWEVAGGSTLFVACFILGDGSGNAFSKRDRFFSAVLCAVLMCILRRVGCDDFAVIISCIAVSAAEYLGMYIKKRIFMYQKNHFRQK